MSVKRAYRNSAGTLTEGSTIAAMAYDGTNRRVSKTITNSGDWGSGPAGASEAVIYNFYHDGQLVIEVRDNAAENQGSVLKQRVWGVGYIDELVQIGINQDPSNNLTATKDENECERFFWACQDANYNVIGIVAANGDLIERYEYTPYGQRTVYSRGWLLADMNDNGTVDIGDYTTYMDASSQNPQDPASRADMNGTGETDIGDYTAWADADEDRGTPYLITPCAWTEPNK